MKKLILILAVISLFGCAKEVQVKARMYKDGQAYFVYGRPIWIKRVKTNHTDQFYHNAIINKKTGKLIDNKIYFPCGQD